LHAHFGVCESLISTLFFLAATPHAAATAAPAPVGPAAVPTVTLAHPTWGGDHLFALYLVQVLFLITVIGLVALMSIQTTKTEGLSGSIGGRMESAYKGRLGIEQQLQRLTTGFAISFMFLAIVNFLITR
jgi:preprotein translocase subunit SecG